MIPQTAASQRGLSSAARYNSKLEVPTRPDRVGDDSSLTRFINIHADTTVFTGRESTSLYSAVCRDAESAADIRGTQMHASAESNSFIPHLESRFSTRIDMSVEKRSESTSTPASDAGSFPAGAAHHRFSIRKWA